VGEQLQIRIVKSKEAKNRDNSRGKYIVPNYVDCMNPGA
jgi:hypothetical protein